VNNTDNDLQEERPPFFKSWKGWYWLVIGVLAVQVVLYYLITIHFA